MPPVARGDRHDRAPAHGSEALAVLALVEGNAPLGERLIPDLPYMRAEVVHACRAELALTLEDVLARRTRIAVAERSRGTRCAEVVADLMAAALGWSPAERARQVAAYRSWVREQAGPLADEFTGLAEGDATEQRVVNE